MKAPSLAARAMLTAALLALPVVPGVLAQENNLQAESVAAFTRIAPVFQHPRCKTP